MVGKNNLEEKLENSGTDGDLVYFMRKVNMEIPASNEDSYLYSFDYETNLLLDSLTKVQSTTYEEFEVDFKQQAYCSTCEKTFYNN